MKYLRIGDFSNIVGVSVKTIRFYEEKGLIKPAYIDKYTGYRYYDEKNIEQILMILQYKNMGFTLEEIKNINPSLLIIKVDFLKELMINIKKNISHIESMIEKGECSELVFVNDEKVIGKWELDNNTTIGWVKLITFYSWNKRVALETFFELLFEYIEYCCDKE